MSATRPPRPSSTGRRSSHWNDERATWVSVYDGDAAALDTDAGRWQVVCERHSTILSVDTLAQARVDAKSDPGEFCEECRDLDCSRCGQALATRHLEWREPGDAEQWANRTSDRCERCAQDLRDYCALPQITTLILIDEPIA